LWTVCRFARRLSADSDGAFDVTVGPLTRLWRRAHRQHRLPDSNRIEEARRAVGYRYLVVAPDTPRIGLSRPGMRLDFGGIAKGYALDEILHTVRRFGIQRALINGGGDLACGEAPTGRRGWPVRIKPWHDGDAAPRRTLPPHDAVATSGDRWQFLEYEGKRYSHLVDPRTGWAIVGRRQVSVLAPTGMEADALASAFIVMKPERAAALAARRPAIGALIEIEQAGRVKRLCIGARRDWFTTNNACPNPQPPAPSP